MATFFKSKEAKEITSGLVMGVITGTVSIILASQYIARKASEAAVARTMAIQNFNRPLRTEYIGNVSDINNIGQVNSMNSMNSSGSLSLKPKPSVSIITNEFYNNQWNPVLSHDFYANTNEELENLIQAHRKSDPFFDASFNGTFNWKGSKIELKNTVEYY